MWCMNCIAYKNTTQWESKTRKMAGTVVVNILKLGARKSLLVLKKKIT